MDHAASLVGAELEPECGCVVDDERAAIGARPVLGEQQVLPAGAKEQPQPGVPIAVGSVSAGQGCLADAVSTGEGEPLGAVESDAGLRVEVIDEVAGAADADRGRPLGDLP